MSDAPGLRIAYNMSAALDADTAEALMVPDAERFRLPVADPMRRGAAHDLTVAVPAPHLIVVIAEGGKTAWEQISPNLYEQATGVRAGGPYDRIGFYGGTDDPRRSFAAQPYETYRLVGSPGSDAREGIRP